MNTGPILIADDDIDDKEFLQHAWNELSYENELIFFKDANGVIDYMESEKKTPFLIISDIQLSGKSGFDLKERLLHSSSKFKSIPFVFWSSAVSKSQVEKAYELEANGVFEKENTIEALKETLIEIVKYWRKCIVPN